MFFHRCFLWLQCSILDSPGSFQTNNTRDWTSCRNVFAPNLSVPFLKKKKCILLQLHELSYSKVGKRAQFQDRLVFSLCWLDKGNFKCL